MTLWILYYLLFGLATAAWFVNHFKLGLQEPGLDTGRYYFATILGVLVVTVCWPIVLASLGCIALLDGKLPGPEQMHNQDPYQPRHRPDDERLPSA
jgi:hypothetical protein